MILSLKNGVIATLLAIVMIASATTVVVYAQAFDICSGGGQASQSEVCKQRSTADGGGIFGPNSLVSSITQTIVFVSAAVAVLMIVVGGLRYVLSQGDPQATQNAKNTILYAFVGLIIAISAEVLLRLVISRI